MILSDLPSPAEARFAKAGNRFPLFGIMRSVLLPQQPAALAGPVAFLFALALVVQLLALGERNLDLGAAFVVEIDFQRHDRHALALDRADQLVDLALM